MSYYSKIRNVDRWRGSFAIMDVEMDVESQSRGSSSPLQDRKGSQQFVHAGRIPLPLRRRHKVADLLKIALCFTAAA
jgi:hypothetical protein